MSNEHLRPFQAYRVSLQPNEFFVYRCSNPATECEYAYLAINYERSIVLSLGAHSVCFDFDVTAEFERWLSHDYSPTGERINLDITGVQGLIVQAFPGGADFGIVRFADELAISRVEMSLWAQKMAEDGPEYIVRAPGSYERWYREYDITAALTPEERAMITGICATFEPLTSTVAHLLTAPVTPRFQRAAAADSESPPASSSLGETGTASGRNLPC